MSSETKSRAGRTAEQVVNEWCESGLQDWGQLVSAINYWAVTDMCPALESSSSADPGGREAAVTGLQIACAMFRAIQSHGDGSGKELELRGLKPEQWYQAVADRLNELRVADPRATGAEGLVCVCRHQRGDHGGLGPSRGRSGFSACGISGCDCQQWRPSKKMSKEATVFGWDVEQILTYVWQNISGEDATEEEYPFAKFSCSEAGKRLRIELNDLVERAATQRAPVTPPPDCPQCGSDSRKIETSCVHCGYQFVAAPAPVTTPGRDAELVQRITSYLSNGGFFNPEMAIHERVRDLLIDCREALAAAKEPRA